MNLRHCLVASALTAIGGISLQAGVRWLATDYDFGTWHEVQGRRTGKAAFVNDGPDTVAITSVRPSCGCTGADYSHEPIAPGDTAWVSFTYDPAHRPGKFEKTVKVYTDPGRQLQVITIRGTIIGTPESLAFDFPIEAGPMRLSGDRHDFGTTAKGTARHAYLTGYNQSADTIYPLVAKPESPLEATIPKTGVAPGESFTVGFYLPTRTLVPGAHSWPLVISAGTASVEATISIDVEPARPILSAAEMASAPRIEVPAAPVELTGGKPGRRIPFRFKVGNAGRSALHLERVYSRAGAVRITGFGRNVKPGRHGTVEGYIELDKVEGPAYGFIIEVISDDPLTPVCTVRVTGQTPR